MKDEHELTEKEKRLAGEPFDSSKLWNEMEDDYLDSITDGIREGADDSSADHLLEDD